MIDSMVDSRDNVVVIDTGVDRVDSSYTSNSSVVVHEGVSFSLTLAVHYIVVVGMRVDSRVGRVDTSYMMDTSMDTRHVVSDSVHKRIRLRLSLTLAVHYIVVVGMRVDSRVGGVDTSYMMDTRDMSVIHSSYSVPNSSVVDQYGVSFSLSIDGNSAQEDKDYGSHGAVDSRDSQVKTGPPHWSWAHCSWSV